MANSSIPNSTPVIGRTSTPSSRLLKKLPDQFSHRRILDLFAIRNQCQSGSDQSTIRRVKGAWWPSRSSKPLSIRYTPDRGRFDSYPLRFSIFDFLFPISYRLAMRGPEIPESRIEHPASPCSRRPVGGESVVRKEVTTDVARANS